MAPFKTGRRPLALSSPLPRKSPRSSAYASRTLRFPGLAMVSKCPVCITPILTLLAFILYRQHYQASVVAQNPGLPNPEISKIIGEHWRTLPENTKHEWKALAEVF